MSRKFITSIVAALIAGLKVYYPDLPDKAIWTVVGSLMGWVFIEGIVDAVSQYAKWSVEKVAILREKPPV
ncbi:MAG: hypothetical protein WDA53_04085 [Bacillota bacterium]